MTRIYADIAGDLLHYGHVEFFKELRSYGDHIIIGLHSDQDIFDYKQKYSVLTMEERRRMVEGGAVMLMKWLSTHLSLLQRLI